ncbi:MAG: hypothetical protein ABIW16_06495 [Sphingomicrobium sp.]
MRIVLVVLLCTLVAVQVVRNTAVRGAARDGSSTALWASHPAIRLQHVMAELGARSAKGQTLASAQIGEVERIARAMPLAPEPFLIKGALADSAGRGADAERLYLAARRRDPRSRAARYLLADRFLRTNRIAQGLSEMAVFSNLAGGSGALAPSLAAYARTPGAIVELRRLFRLTPNLEEPVLTELSGDAANADLVLALRSARPRTGADSAAPRWQARLVGSLIAHGEFERAHRIWATLSGVPEASRGLFNPAFRKLAPPPPFNWTYGSTGGVAEPLDDGRLQLNYFGREDTVLAEQVILLGTGSYTMAFELGGNVKDSLLAWTITCLPAQVTIVTMPIGQTAAPTHAARFTVPAQGCPAQRLQLAGTASEFASSTEFTIGKLSLTKAGGG